MQKTTLFIAVILSLIEAGCGCGLNGCKCVDCAGNDAFVVEFLSKTDSTDLLKSGVIVADSLQIFQIKDQKNKFYDWLQLKAALGKGPYLTVDSGVSAYIFQYTANERDTLFLQSHATERGECCGGNSVLDAAVFRGSTVKPVLDNRGFILTLLK